MHLPTIIRRATRLGGAAPVWAALVWAALAAHAASDPSPPDKTLIAWQFDRAGRLEGWRPNGHVRSVAVTDGAVHAAAVDWDPFLVSPQFDIPARPWQHVEVRIRADKGGTGQLFWTGTLRTKYGGFSPGKHTDFHVRGGEWQTLRIRPFWHTEGRIILLRLDLYDGAAFDVDFVRVVEPAAAQPVRKTDWTFESGAEGWRRLDAPGAPTAADGTLTMRLAGADDRLFAPPLRVAVDERLWVAVRMKLVAPRSGVRPASARLWFAADEVPGLGVRDFPVRADGRFRTYNVDMAACPQWRGRLLALGLTPAQAAGATAVIDRVQLACEPCGPPDVEVDYFGFADAINRAQKPAKLLAVVRNTGGQTARGLRARLIAPAGLELADGPAERNLPPTEPFETARVTWTVRSPVPGEVPVRLALAGLGAPAEHPAARVRFTPSPKLPKADYVPRPRPVACPYEIGAFYFPGWHRPERWEPIRRVAPIRKPVLGWYDEADPRCADWQIKWAVEHGVRFFIVDWYWDRGRRQLDHWLHRAYRNARYRKYLKFCLMWANHNGPGSHSLADWRDVTRYWIEHYFPMPEYYRIDGRPAVYVWAPGNIRRDVGGSAKAAELYALSQQMARQAGYQGVYFVAMSSHQSPAARKRLRAEGYEAFTSYHSFEATRARLGTSRFPFRLVVEDAPALWAACDQQTDLRYLPIVDTGWSSEPWHGDRALIIHGRTPALFGRLCRLARRHADRTGRKILTLGPWNEWGEGSYIEPCAEYGFQMLDELRAAFCAPGPYPPNVAPVDVGLGPYDLPVRERRFAAAWDFATDGDAEGWAPLMGLRDFRVAGGGLAATAATGDPALISPPLRIRAGRHKALTVRMTVAGARKGDACQVFWQTRTTPICEPCSLRLPLAADERPHDYVFRLGDSARWRGLVTKIRLDPCGAVGARIRIDSVRFAE